MPGPIQGIADVLALVLLFGFTIFVHELGHFLVAIRCGMVVDVFSIGFGPAIWKKTIRGITYKIGCIPVGGYVALPQLDPSGMSTVQGKGEEGKAPAGGNKTGADGKPEEAEEPERNLPPISAGKKILVSLAGCVGNLIFAVILAWIIYLSPDTTSKEISTQVGYVATNSLAYEEGLRAGDQIVAVNGTKVNSWYDYSVESMLGAGPEKQVNLTFLREGQEKTVRLPLEESPMGALSPEGVDKSHQCVLAEVLPGSVAEKAGLLPDDQIMEFNGLRVSGIQHFTDMTELHGGQEVLLAVLRGKKTVTVPVTPQFNAEVGKAMIGVRVAARDPFFAVWMMHRNPWDQVRNDALGIWRILKALVTPRESGQAAKGLGGPLLIFAALWAAIKISWLNAFGFIRFLNVNLAILNMLPIPVLDGGHIVFSLWEGITRRRVPARVVNALVNVFAALLIGAILLITFNDAKRLYTLKKLRDQIRAEEKAENNTPPPAAESPAGTTNAADAGSAP